METVPHLGVRPRPIGGGSHGSDVCQQAQRVVRVRVQGLIVQRRRQEC